MQVSAANTQHTCPMEALSGVIFEVLSLLFAGLHALMRQHCLSPNPGVTEQIYELRNEMYASITRMGEKITAAKFTLPLRQLRLFL